MDWTILKDLAPVVGIELMAFVTLGGAVKTLTGGNFDPTEITRATKHTKEIFGGHSRQQTIRVVAYIFGVIGLLTVSLILGEPAITNASQ